MGGPRLLRPGDDAGFSQEKFKKQYAGTTEARKTAENGAVPVQQGRQQSNSFPPHVGPEVRFGVRLCAMFAQTAPTKCNFTVGAAWPTP